MKKLICMICLCFLLFGFVGCNSSENHISKELYEKGLSHNSKLFLLQYEQEYDEIPKEINSFKEYVKANNFENNDKIFIETINNIDSLYDKILQELSRKPMTLVTGMKAY